MGTSPAHSIKVKVMPRRQAGYKDATDLIAGTQALLGEPAASNCIARKMFRGLTFPSGWACTVLQHALAYPPTHVADLSRWYAAGQFLLLAVTHRGAN